MISLDKIILPGLCCIALALGIELYNNTDSENTNWGWGGGENLVNWSE